MAGLNLASAFVLVACSHATNDYSALWEDFKVTYNRVFDGDESRRFEIFKGKIDYINEENAKNNSFSLGINQFSDRTAEELAPLFRGARVPKSHAAGSPYLGRHVRSGAALPASVDWTTKGAVTAVKDQKICGSCWAFSATAALEGAGAITTGQLVSLAEQQTMQCSRAGTDEYGRGCDGGWPDEVFTYAVDNDLCTEASYPYQGVETIPCFWNMNPPKCTDVGLSKNLVSGYKDVTADSEEELMSAVAQQPVSVALDTEAWLSYKGGIFDGCTGTGMDHAVLVVGYAEEYWKIRNSWGSSWGEDGYIRLKRGAGVHGMCGLLQKPSYPVVSHVVV